MIGVYNKVRFFRVFLVLWITYAVYTMARRPFSVARADIQRDTGLTTAEFSLLDTVFMFSYTVGQLGYGYVKKHWGNKEILSLGIFFSSLSLICMSLSSSIWAFCIAWAINGLSQAAGWATCLSILSLWIFQNERGAVIGWWSTNMAVGGAMGNIIPAFIIGKGFSWRLAIEVEIVIQLIVGAMILMLLLPHPNVVGFLSVQQMEGENMSFRTVLKDELYYKNKDVEVQFTPLHSRSSLDDRSSSFHHHNVSKNARSISLTFWEIIKLPGIVGICASYFLHKLVRYGFMFWLPYFSVQELKYTTEFAGYLTSAFDIGGVVGTVVSGYFSDWLFHGKGRTRVILLLTVGMIMTTFSFAAFSHLFAENTLLFTIVVACVGFFSFSIDALMSGSFLLDFLERVNMSTQAGAVSGVVGGVGSAGSIFQGVFTIVMTSNSWATLFYSFGIATTMASFCLIRPLCGELRGGGSVT